LPLLLISLQLRPGQGLTMKLIDGFAHFAQVCAQFLLFLALDRYLNEGNYSECQDSEHGYRDHQLDE
jgi:hypothetical protein